MGGLPWLKLDGDSPLHPKVARLEAALAIPDAYGIIARVWCWTSKYAPAGIVLPEDQPSFAKWVTSSLLLSTDTVVQCLIECRVLDQHRKGLEVHGWDESQSAHIKKAEGNKNRQQALRDRNALRNAPTVTDRNATEKRRVEKSREDKIRSEKTSDVVDLDPPQKATTLPSPKAAKAEGRSTPAWRAYSAAYLERWKAEPPRNYEGNRKLCELIEAIGAEDAPAVAAFYVTHNQALYVAAKHPLALLARDANKMHTDWKTGKQSTMIGAQLQERTEENYSGWARHLSQGAK